MIFIILFQIIISEIMVNPNGSEYHNEFIEVYNTSNTNFDMRNLSISDGVATDDVLVYKGSPYLKPGEYALIFDPSYFNSEQIYGQKINQLDQLYIIDNSSFGSNGFSNSGDEMITLSVDGLILDSYITDRKNEEGYSNERRINNGLQWLMSIVVNGTAGYKNSVDKYLEFLKIDNINIESNRIELVYHNISDIPISSEYQFSLKSNDNSYTLTKVFEINLAASG